MYRSLFPRDLFAELDRLQRDVQQAFDLSPTIRGVGRGGFPALNVGATPQSFSANPTSATWLPVTEGLPHQFSPGTGLIGGTCAGTAA